MDRNIPIAIILASLVWASCEKDGADTTPPGDDAERATGVLEAEPSSDPAPDATAMPEGEDDPEGDDGGEEEPADEDEPEEEDPEG